MKQWHKKAFIGVVTGQLSYFKKITCSNNQFEAIG